MKQRVLCLWLCVLLLCGCVSGALAEDCFTIDVDLLDMDSLNSDDYVARRLSASTQGVRVRKYISQSSELAAPVRLTLTQMDSRTVLLDKDYGFQGGTFDSGVIYLPYVGDRTIPYLVTLYVGDYVYAMPFMQLQARLHANGASTRGARLGDLDARLDSDWLMGTMVDLDDLRSAGSQRVDVCASNSYVIGYADLTLSGSDLCVNLAFNSSAQVEVEQFALYVVTECADFAGSNRAPEYSVGEQIHVGDAHSALIYLPMQVSYDPAGLPSFSYRASGSEVQSQIALWNENVGGSGSSQNSNGWFSGDTEEDDGWSDGGWSDDGWDNGGWGDGWDDGWTGTGDGWMDAPAE